MIGRRSKITIEASWLLDLRPSPKGLPAPEWKIASNDNWRFYLKVMRLRHAEAAAAMIQTLPTPWAKSNSYGFFWWYSNYVVLDVLAVHVNVERAENNKEMWGASFDPLDFPCVYTHIWIIYIYSHMYLSLFVSLLISWSLYMYLFSMRASHPSTWNHNDATVIPDLSQRQFGTNHF